MPFIPDPADPFYELMQPPTDEMPAQKTARIKRELDAQRRNDAINEQIDQDRANSQKSKEAVKILLLGQSESGKSTMLKDFRRKYAREEWEQERDSWRIVIQLNIVQFINAIIKVVESEMNRNVPMDSDNKQNVNEPNDAEAMKFTDRHHLLLIRLAPLLNVEEDLKRRLGAGSDKYIFWEKPLPVTPSNALIGNGVQRERESSESIGSWKDVLNLVRLWQHVLNPESGTNSETASSVECSDSISATIISCKDDMKALWKDKTVRVALTRRRFQFNDTAGCFLNDLDRVTAPDDVITDDDIMRARLRTAKIQEHRIYFKKEWPGTKRQIFTSEWRIFDVGGNRTKRRAWLPFFDNVNVVIFFLPVSVFDERLEEDPHVNRLEDSVMLWASICSSKLLTRTQLVLFLTKCDLLRRKLKRGVQMKQYVPSYGDQPNEVMAVVKYLCKNFQDIARRHSVQHCVRHVFPATFTDTIATIPILEIIHKCILREHLLTLDSHLI